MECLRSFRAKSPPFSQGSWKSLSGTEFKAHEELAVSTHPSLLNGPESKIWWCFLDPESLSGHLKGLHMKWCSGWSQLHWETWGNASSLFPAPPAVRGGMFYPGNRVGMDGTTPTATAPSPILHIPVATVKCIMWRRTDHFLFFFSLGQEKMSSLKMAGIFLIFEMSHFALFFFISGRGETVNLCVKFSYYCSTDQKIIEFLFLSSRRLRKSEFHYTPPNRCYILVKGTRWKRFLIWALEASAQGN